MRVIMQKVSCATVKVDDVVVDTIGTGLAVFVGIRSGDSLAEAEHLAKLVMELQLFPSADGTRSLSMSETLHEILVIDQPSLYARFELLRPVGQRIHLPAAAPRLLDAFVQKLLDFQRAPLGQEKVVIAPLGPGLKVELTSDGLGMYSFDTGEAPLALSGETDWITSTPQWCHQPLTPGGEMWLEALRLEALRPRCPAQCWHHAEYGRFLADRR
jgi:D-tyrosyl-tRNA(Tyr) deacylase